jgi:hypothetical protein
MSLSGDDERLIDEAIPPLVFRVLPPQVQDVDLACCDMMRRWAFEGDDILVEFNPRMREWGVPIPDYFGGGTVVFEHCPWCGVRLPESLRDRYFEELWALSESGEDVPEWDTRPPEYHTSAWWRRRGL